MPVLAGLASHVASRSVRQYADYVYVRKASPFELTVRRVAELAEVGAADCGGLVGE